MKFNSFLRLNYLKSASHCKSQVKCIVTQPEGLKYSQNLLNVRNREKVKYTIVKNKILNKASLENENFSVCAIALAINHVSWANISIPDLTLIDWDAFLLPQGLAKCKMEPKNLTLANEVHQNIPMADFYVMERQVKYGGPLREMCVKAMLLVLLSIDKDALVADKVVFQHPSVVNKTHNLSIGRERKSARPVISDLLNHKSTDIDGNKQVPDWCLQVDISEMLRSLYSASLNDKKESLSLALLLGLSFLNKRYFESNNQ